MLQHFPVNDEEPPGTGEISNAPLLSHRSSNAHLLDISRQFESIDSVSQRVGDPVFNANEPRDNSLRRVMPSFSLVLLISTILVFSVCDCYDCSQPLAWWSLVYVSRHILKTLLYTFCSSRESPAIDFVTGMVRLSGPMVWTMGGYYIFRTSACNQGIYAFASTLWALQSVAILLPCCLLSTIIFCAPCLIWIVPYIIPPNPNTIATREEIVAKIPKCLFEQLPPTTDESCSICLADYSGGDQVMQLPCGHVFHAKCIEEWLNLSQLCAICRSNIVTSLDIPV